MIALSPAFIVHSGVTNPDISALGQVLLSNPADPQIHGGKSWGLSLGETELVLDAALNPYSKGMFTFSIGEKGFEIEEAYASIFQGLPLNLSVKTGKFRCPFGKWNAVHPHAYPFIRCSACLESGRGRFAAGCGKLQRCGRRTLVVDRNRRKLDGPAYRGCAAGEFISPRHIGHRNPPGFSTHPTSSKSGENGRVRSAVRCRAGPLILRSARRSKSRVWILKPSIRLPRDANGSCLESGFGDGSMDPDRPRTFQRTDFLCSLIINSRSAKTRALFTSGTGTRRIRPASGTR